MNWFHFGKKRKKEPSRTACIGVLDLFVIEESKQLLILGRLTGSLKVGDSLRIYNIADSKDSLGMVTVESLSDGTQDVDTLTDEGLAQIVVKQSEAVTLLKKGSVLTTSDVEEKQLLSFHAAALYVAFVTVQKGDMSNDDVQRASLEDSIEILHMFMKECRQNQETDTEQNYQENLRKIAHLEEVVGDKLLGADEIYAVYSEATGEPYMFSKTYDRGDGGYLCTDPLIKILTPGLYEYYGELLDYPGSQIKKIENGEDKQGIRNFLGTAFYLNGALGAIINYDEEVQIKASNLVEEPDFSAIPEIEVPVMNPDLVRWLLLLGQLGDPDTDEKQLIYSLYYGFQSRALRKAKFLIPIKKGDNFPKESKEAQKIELEKGANFYLPVREGKKGRQSISVFTDWKRLRMVFDEEWSGMMEPAGNMISLFDYAVNPTQYLQAGCYVSQDAFEKMKKLDEMLRED